MKRLSRKKTKRVTLRRKHAIVKRAAETKKKLRKEARRMMKQGIKKPTKKEPGIPNLCPQKKELLEELQVQKALEADHRREIRQKSKEMREKQEFSELTQVKAPFTHDNSIEALVESSDLIIEVLDARDPFPYPLLDNLLQSKPRIFVLNKSDLVPEKIVKKWQRKINKIAKSFIYCVPSEESQKKILMDFLESLGKITVGVIGYPNVGKSAFINSIKGYQVTGVTKLPGGTKKIEEIEISDKIKMLDSPGLKISGESPIDNLRSITNLENLQDPYTPVQGILERIEKEKLLVLYAIPDFTDIKEFLTHIAKKTGKVAKGGIPDYDSAAKIVLHDWCTMKISFYTPIN